MKAVLEVMQQQGLLITQVIVILRHLLRNLVEGRNQHIDIDVSGVRQLILALRASGSHISDELLFDGVSLCLVITHVLHDYVVIMADKQASGSG